jgi:hypothetical protein
VHVAMWPIVSSTIALSSAIAKRLRPDEPLARAGGGKRLKLSDDATRSSEQHADLDGVIRCSAWLAVVCS